MAYQRRRRLFPFDFPFGGALPLADVCGCSEDAGGGSEPPSESSVFGADSACTSNLGVAAAACAGVIPSTPAACVGNGGMPTNERTAGWRKSNVCARERSGRASGQQAHGHAGSGHPELRRAAASDLRHGERVCRDPIHKDARLEP